MVQIKSGSGKRILLTNHRLCNYAGSELVTLDLAAEFKKRGCHVVVGCFELSSQLEFLFNDIGVKCIDLNCGEVPENFDVHWGHHFTTFDKCMIDISIRSPRVVFSSLSPFEPLECPPIFANYLTAILANSEETASQLIVHGVQKERIILFENSVPDYYFDLSIKPKTALERIAVISNHVPDELILSTRQLQLRAQIDFYGINHTHVHVTPELLSQYDLVITIGRTVQQCFALGIPVYCYDRFGGPGYIDPAMFDLAASFNFSGRCTRRRLSPDALALDIETKYRNAVGQTGTLKSLTENRYRLSAAVTRVFNVIEETDEDVHLPETLKVTLRRQRQILAEQQGVEYAQIFYDKGHGFNEKDSIRKDIRSGLNSLTFELKDVDKLESLRFDPANFSCVVSISRFVIMAPGLEIDILPRCQNNADFIIDGHHCFYTNDPQVLAVTADLSLSHLTVTVEVDLNFAFSKSEAREKILYARIQMLTAELEGRTQDVNQNRKE